jgi:hypothetical protein
MMYALPLNSIKSIILLVSIFLIATYIQITCEVELIVEARKYIP